MESSVGTMWINVQVQDQASPSTNYAWVMSGCEDNVYFHCLHPGNEGSPTSIAKCFQCTIPEGKITLDSCDFFGQCDFNHQQSEIIGGVIGPITINNSVPNSKEVLSLQGVYLYDGGSGTARACIDTSTNLCNIQANGCYIVANVETNFINGNIPTGNTLEFDG